MTFKLIFIVGFVWILLRLVQRERLAFDSGGAGIEFQSLLGGEGGGLFAVWNTVNGGSGLGDCGLGHRVGDFVCHGIGPQTQARSFNQANGTFGTEDFEKK